MNSIAKIKNTQEICQCGEEMLLQSKHSRWFCCNCRKTKSIVNKQRDPVSSSQRTTASNAIKRANSRASQEFTLLTKAVCQAINHGVPLPEEYRKYPKALLATIARERIRAKKLEKNKQYWRETLEELAKCEKCGQMAIKNSSGHFYCCHCRHVTPVAAIAKGATLMSAIAEETLTFYLQVRASTGLWPLLRDACVELKLPRRKLGEILKDLRATGRL